MCEKLMQLVRRLTIVSRSYVLCFTAVLYLLPDVQSLVCVAAPGKRI